MFKFIYKLFLKIRLKKLGLDLNSIKNDMYWCNVREKMKLPDKSFNEVINNEFSSKGEIKIYFDVVGFSDDGMYATLHNFDSYEEALKFCSDLNWNCEYHTNYGKEDLHCKIIKVISEVLT